MSDHFYVLVWQIKTQFKVMSTQRKPDQSKNLFFPDFANQQICKQSLAVYIVQYMWINHAILVLLCINNGIFIKTRWWLRSVPCFDGFRLQALKDYFVALLFYYIQVLWVAWMVAFSSSKHLNFWQEMWKQS